MYVREIFEGKYILLRSVKEEDAEFILKLRTDDKMNNFVHKVDNDVKKEKSWIRNQHERLTIKSQVLK